LTLRNAQEAFEILLVEDNPGDARLAQEALKEGRMTSRLKVVVDGVEAMSFLRREGQYQGSPRPNLILLDLNLPRKDGRQVLAELKADEDLRRIPVVVLTTSEEQQDKVNSFDLGVAGYMAKPVDYRQFVEVMRSINTYWTISEMPE